MPTRTLKGENSVATSVTLPISLITRLDRIANKEYIPRTTLIRRLLILALDKTEKDRG